MKHGLDMSKFEDVVAFLDVINLAAYGKSPFSPQAQSGEDTDTEAETETETSDTDEEEAE